jgi:hypothetical protein
MGHRSIKDNNFETLHHSKLEYWCVSYALCKSRRHPVTSNYINTCTRELDGITSKI